MRDLEPSRYGEANCREVDPPIEVESATWSTGGQLNWWVKDRTMWLGGSALRTAGRQGWVKAVDLRAAENAG